MNDQKPLDYTGDTVEAAISKGLDDLGVSANDVLVEVLEEPTRGILGIGAKPARVRLKLLRPPMPATPPPAPAPVIPAAPTPPKPEPAAVKAPGKPSQSFEDEAAEEEYLNFDTVTGVSDEELDDEGRVAKQVLAELLERMRVRADIKVVRAQADEDERAPWLLNIDGRKVNMLIGRRGDTLAALQYLTRLITSRRLQRRATIVVDVAGYKARRSKSLHDLATRMAEQAVRQSRTVSLEPMPPHERRMIHMALRNRTDVYTKSTGDGDSRKVTIIPR